MKCTRFALLAAFACGAFASSARGESPYEVPSRHAAALTYDYYYQPAPAQPSPSDMPTAPPPMREQPVAQTSCTEPCEKDAESVCDPWRLFPEIGCGWTLDGHIAGGATANAAHPVSRYNGPLPFNDREEVQFNQLYLSFGRDAETCGCGFDWGARLDMLYGSDYIFTQATGLETQPDGSNALNGHRHYGLAIPQAYAELAFNRSSLKLGHFYTTMGYEVVPATGNFFYSHAYTHQYSEPFTHTGALFTHRTSDMFNWHVGLVNGWDKFDAQHDMMALLSGFTYTPYHQRYTLTLTSIIGEEDGTAAATLGTRSFYSLVFLYNVTDNLQYVFNNDIGHQENAGGPGVDAEWYGICQYLFYTINECWRVGARAEWWRDDDGYRLGGVYPIREVAFGGAPALTPAQAAGNYYETAFGVNWTPSANLRVRPEIRWDWSDDTVGRPYDDGGRDSQFTAAFDAIYLF